MSTKTTPDKLGQAIQRELTIYSENLTDSVNTAGDQAIKKLVKLTKTTAPVGVRGTFKKNIASKEEQAVSGMKKYVWYVKAPDYRLTHLLVHGHATVTGGRTKANPFLKNALDEVLPEYEKSVEEAARNGK